MEITNSQQIEALKSELSSFPRLAQKYLANLFLILMNASKHSESMVNITQIVGTFERLPHYQSSVGGMSREVARQLYFSITNFIIAFSELNFTDDEFNELEKYLQSLTSNSVREKIKARGDCIFTPAEVIEKEFHSKVFWRALDRVAKVKATDIIEVEDFSQELETLIRDLVGEKFTESKLHLAQSSGFYQDYDSESGKEFRLIFERQCYPGYISIYVLEN